MAKAPSTPSTPSGGSDDPSWMPDQQNPIAPDSDSVDQLSRDAEVARQGGTSQTGAEQAGTTQQ